MAGDRKGYNLISLSSKSCECVVNEFKVLDEVSAKSLYMDILKAVKEVLQDYEIDCLRNLSLVLREISNIKSAEWLRNFPQTDRKENFNLISLACRNKAAKTLHYIFSEEGQTLYNLSANLAGVSKNDQLICATDEFCHNAFYYAIRSNMTDLLCILIDKWQSLYGYKALDDILSQNYKELKLRNVSLEKEMQLFVQNKILDLRFFHANAADDNTTGNTCEEIKKRIDIVVRYAQSIKKEYWNRDPDQKFIFIAESIAKSIHVLKCLLKSTYDRLPWEEIEFCLVIFIRCCKDSSEQNVTYNCVLNKEKILMHLFNFSLVLDQQRFKFENDVIKLAKKVKLRRDDVIKRIIKKSCEFRELYDDYETIRDSCSLEIIKEYFDLIDIKDITGKRKFMLISRVLQVTGEHLKNTLDSPKLSTKTGDALLNSLSSNTREVITKLRDSLSHEETLFIRSEIDKKRHLFKNILTDISRIQAVIPDILYTLRITAVKILMKKLKFCESFEEMRKCYGPYRHSLEQCSFTMETTDLIKGDFERLEELLISLDKCLTDKTMSEKMCFDQLYCLFREENERLADIKKNLQNYKRSVLHLSFSLRGEKHFYNDFREIANRLAVSPLEAPGRKIKLSENLFKSLCSTVVRRTFPGKEDILRKIVVFLFCEMGSVKWIDEFRNIVCEKVNKTWQNRKQKHRQSENFLTSKILQLKEELILLNFKDDTSSVELSSFESDTRLRAATEMLVLDILGILESSCTWNPFFLDSDFPVLIGKNLRNHLSHKNTLIDVCLEEIAAQLLENARKLLNATFIKNGKKIDRVIKCDCNKLEKSIEDNLRIISNQEKLFVALSEGNMTNVEESVHEGADVYGKDCNSWTCLHFAAKAPGIAALKWVLKQGLDVSSEDNAGQTVLHTASKFDRIEVIRYLVERKQMDLDMSGVKDKSLLRFSGNTQDVATLQWILKQSFLINSNQSAAEVVSQIAVELNRREEKQCWVEEGCIPLIARDLKGKTPLHIAVENQSHNVIEYISNFEICKTIKDKYWFTPLHTAIYTNSIDLVKILLEKEANVDENKANGNHTALHLATMNGNLTLVKLLMAKNARIHSKSDDGKTPLHAAAVLGHFEILKILVMNGADVNAKDEAGITPLQNAALKGSVEVVQFLLDHEAEINVFDNRHLTPLMKAAAWGHLSVTELLLEKGAHVNSKDNLGCTPLLFASKRGHFKIVELLLNHKALVDCKNNEKETALHVSALGGHKKIVELLLKEGADINARDSTKSTPLHLAASGGHEYIVDLLIDEGADINCKEELGFTALHFACYNVDRGMAKSLLDKGANIHAPCENLLTPFYIFISNRLSDLLTNEMKDVNFSDVNGFTLLHVAAACGDHMLVKYCVENGCNINSLTHTGLTAMHLAAMANHQSIVRILLKNGADISLKIDNIVTPLVAAAQRNNRETLKVLASQNYDFNFKRDDIINALEESVEHGHCDSIDILLQEMKFYHFDINNDLKFNLFHTAVCRNDRQVVTTLFKNGFKIEGDAKLLQISVVRKNYEIVEVLLANGADPNFLDENNLTPLHIASESGDAEMVEMLLSQRAGTQIEREVIWSAAELAVREKQLDVIKVFLQMKVIKTDARGKSDYTLLHYSALSGSLDITKYLVAEGADINAKNKKNRKPVHIAADEGFKDTVEFYINCSELEDETAELLLLTARNGHAKICELLIQRIPDVNKFYSGDVTPMHFALLNSRKDVVCVLLHHGAYYNAHQQTLKKLNEDNGAASLLRLMKKLFIAVRNNAPLEVENILKMKINSEYCLANAKCVRKETVLHYASWKGYDKIVDVLLKYNANPNARTKTGNTPLHYAAYFSHFTTLKALLSNGAMYNGISQKEKTPLDYATDKNIRDLLLFLRYIFSKVRDKDLSVLENLVGKDESVMRTLIRARNQENKTLLDVACIYGFPLRKELEMSFETDLYIDQVLMTDTESIYLDNYPEFISDLEKALKQKIAVFGANSHPVLDIKNWLAGTFRKQGNLDEALDLYLEVYKIRKNSLGEYHLSLHPEDFGIGSLYLKKGETQKALHFLEKMRMKLKECLNNDAFLSLIIVENQMITALFAMKKFDDALQMSYEIQQKCAQKKENLYRKELAHSLSAAAEILIERKKPYEALKLVVKAYDTIRDVLAHHSPGVLSLISKVAEMFRNLEIIDESLKIYEEVLDIKRSLLPENDLEVLDGEYRIGEIFYQQGKLASAFKLLSSVEPKCAALDPNSGLLKATKRLLGTIKHDLGRIQFKTM